MNEETLDEGVGEGHAEVWADYTCRSIKLGSPHPGNIVEAGTLASVSLPPCTYDVSSSLEHQIEKKLLSNLQLEAISYAGQRHLNFLPNGSRCGFFIGDSAGVGKGRQIAATIVDNIVRGRLKHLWFSSSADLIQDARRDFKDLDCEVSVLDGCKAVDKATKGLGIDSSRKSAVLFSTYAGLISTGSAKSKSSRFHQVVEWCGGENFEGCLIFDECHKAKNNRIDDTTKNSSSKVAQYVLEIQRMLPKARVVYASATGFSEVGNMQFLDRMGIWGEGCTFASFKRFCQTMERRSMGALELLAMEFKASGSCVMRQLGFHNAEFAVLEADLTVEQVDLYRRCCDLWETIRAAIESSPDVGRLWTVYWGAHQRFFKQLCMAIKIPKVVEEAQRAIAAGMCVVVGLQSTGESALKAELSSNKEADERRNVKSKPKTNETVHSALVGGGRNKQPRVQDHVSACRNIVVQFLRTQLLDDTAPYRSKLERALPTLRHVLDLVQRMDLPQSALDNLIDSLGGVDQVAELTGRSKRMVRSATGDWVCKPRVVDSNAEDAAASVNQREQLAFMEGRKLVAVISDAASTGISLHAHSHCANNRRRLHVTLELPWAADTAVQQLGRTHRTFQTSAPFYKLVTSGLGGETRFVSCISSRLQQLGALTRGDRRANSSGLSLSEFDFGNRYGRRALSLLYDATVSDQVVPGISWQVVVEGAERMIQLALAVPKSDAGTFPQAERITSTRAFLRHINAAARVTGEIGEAHGGGQTISDANKKNVQKFLNRLLGIPVHLQALIFEYFTQILQMVTSQAITDGTFDSGVSEISGERIDCIGNELLRKDNATGATTNVVSICVDRGVSFEQACGLLIQARIAAGESCEEATKTGRITETVGSFYKRELKTQSYVLLGLRKVSDNSLMYVTRPNTGRSMFDKQTKDVKHSYKAVTEEDAKALWDKLYDKSLSACTHREGFHPTTTQQAACTFGTRKQFLSIVCGAVTPVLPILQTVLLQGRISVREQSASLRIARAVMHMPQGGQSRVVGIQWPPALIPALRAAIKFEESKKESIDGRTGERIEVSTPHGGGIGLLSTSTWIDCADGALVRDVAESPILALQGVQDGDKLIQVDGTMLAPNDGNRWRHYVNLKKISSEFGKLHLVFEKKGSTKKVTTTGDRKTELATPVVDKWKRSVLEKPKTLHSFFKRGKTNGVQCTTPKKRKLNSAGSSVAEPIELD